MKNNTFYVVFKSPSNVIFNLIQRCLELRESDLRPGEVVATARIVVAQSNQNQLKPINYLGWFNHGVMMLIPAPVSDFSPRSGELC